MVVGWEDSQAAAVRDLHDRASVGGLQHSQVEDLAGRPEGDLSPVEADDEVPAPSLFEIVGGNQDSASLACKVSDQGLKPVRAGCVEPGEGLIEQQQASIL